ncbi:MAG: hypothetical protein R6W76_04220 [Caldilinea sp.]
MKMEMELYQEVALTRDIPSANLKVGDVVTLIDVVSHPTGGEDGAILEVFNAVGESIAVITVPLSAIARLRADQIPAVRFLVYAA